MKHNVRIDNSPILRVLDALETRLTEVEVDTRRLKVEAEHLGEDRAIGRLQRDMLKLEMRLVVTLVPLLEEIELLRELRGGQRLLKERQTPVARRTTGAPSADAKEMPTLGCKMAQGFD